MHNYTSRASKRAEKECQRGRKMHAKHTVKFKSNQLQIAARRYFHVHIGNENSFEERSFSWWRGGFGLRRPSVIVFSTSVVAASLDTSCRVFNITIIFFPFPNETGTRLILLKNKELHIIIFRVRRCCLCILRWNTKTEKNEPRK